MELMKKHILVYKREKEASAQMTLDEDFNVTDHCADVGRLIQYDGRIQIDEVKVSESRVFLNGTLIFKVLFAVDGAPGCVERLDGSVPFEETMNLEGVGTGDKIYLKWDVEDLSIQLIHSRKLNIRALITFLAAAEQEKEVPLTTELRMDGVSEKKESVEVLSLHLHNRDTLRIRDTFLLSSNKPDIRELVWDALDVRGIDVRMERQKTIVKGEIFAFLLYKDHTESETLQWLEYALPFQKELPCEGCTEHMVPELDMTLLQASLSVKPDADGEERLIQVEVLLESDLRIYEEETLELLLDVYHPTCELIPVREHIAMEQLLIKNYAKCRIQEKVTIEEQDGRILQICHSDGMVRIEESYPTERGIQVEGYLQVDMLYITGIDEMPFYSTETMVPFSMLVEAPEIDRECKWYLHSDLEQLSTTMSDGNGIEIKALINLNAIVLREKEISNIVSLEERELDFEKLKKMPGIVGYVVQPGDTLWDIAKRFYTSVEQIKEINHLQDETIHPKDTLILLKNVKKKTISRSRDLQSIGK